MTRRNKAISEMGEMTTPATDDYITTLDSSEAAGSKNKRMTFDNLVTWLGGYFGSATIPGGVTDNFVGIAADDSLKDSGSKASDFAVAAKGVTNGDTHDHSGGDGAQISHAGLSNLTAGDPHTQYTKHITTNTTITVGSGKDYAMIQGAIDSLNGYVISDGAIVTIAVDAGSYAELLTIDGYVCTPDSAVLIQGDARAAAGIAYEVSAVDDTTDAGRLIFTIATMAGTYSDWTNADDLYLSPFGAVDIYSVTSATSCRVVNTYNTSRYGNTVAAALNVTAVAQVIASQVYRYTFSDTPHASIKAGMKLSVSGAALAAGNKGLFWIKSVNAGAKTIDVVNASGSAETKAGTAYAISAFVSPVPDRILPITSAGVICVYVKAKVTIDGFYINQTTGASSYGLGAYKGGIPTLRNCIIKGTALGVYAEDYATVSMTNCSIPDSPYGIWATYLSSVYLSGVVFSNITNSAVYALYQAFVQCLSSIKVAGANIGVLATSFSFVWSANSVLVYCIALRGIWSDSHSYIASNYNTAVGCACGYYSSYNSFIMGLETNAKNLGNTTNYSPAVSDTEGNVSAIITYS